MRRAAFFAMVCMLAAAPAGTQPAAFLPVAIDYSTDRDATLAGIASDLDVVQSLHFNSVRYTLRWSEAEPARGTLMLGPLDRVLEAAAQRGLRVIVRVDTTAPSWLFARYPDAQRRTSDAAARRAACFDHPDARADMLRFVTAASKSAAKFKSLLSIDIGSDPPVGLCLCPHTRTRVQALAGADREDPAAMVEALLRADLAEVAARVRQEAATRALVTGHAGLLLRDIVDQYGTTIDAKSSSPERLALALDAISDGGALPGWSLVLDSSVAERDRRLVTWAAIARGARALIFEDPPEPGLTATISRNPALFSQLVPRRGAPEVRIDGGTGIEVRMLESDRVLMIVGLNYTGRSPRVTMTFPPDTQEAIWQNMETGAGVNFIAGTGGVGPSYTYWFRPKDALVLMIRKDIR